MGPQLLPLKCFALYEGARQKSRQWQCEVVRALAMIVRVIMITKGLLCLRHISKHLHVLSHIILTTGHGPMKKVLWVLFPVYR